VSEGSVLGIPDKDGWLDATSLGTDVGEADGPTLGTRDSVGELDPVTVGSNDDVGLVEGSRLGISDKEMVCLEGFSLGSLDADGSLDGTPLGLNDNDGLLDGKSDGDSDKEGSFVGSELGRLETSFWLVRRNRARYRR
jgi:hypothetical protein